MKEQEHKEKSVKLGNEDLSQTTANCKCHAATSAKTNRPSMIGLENNNWFLRAKIALNSSFLTLGKEGRATNM